MIKNRCKINAIMVILVISILLVIIFNIAINKNYKIIIFRQFIKVKENIRPNKNDYCDNLYPIKLFSLSRKRTNNNLSK